MIIALTGMILITHKAAKDMQIRIYQKKLSDGRSSWSVSESRGLKRDGTNADTALGLIANHPSALFDPD